MDPEIRPIEAPDLPALGELLLAFEDDDSEGFVGRWLGEWPRENERGVVALGSAGEIVGACWFRPLREPQHIPEVILGVAAGHRGAGLGRSLLAANVAQAEELGLSALQVAVRVDNRPARRLLEEYTLWEYETKSETSLNYAIVLNDRIVFLGP